MKVLCPLGLLLCTIVLAQDQPAPQPARGMTIPAGTAIAIRTIDAIDSEGADMNRDYAASLADPLIVNDVTVAPQGANCVLRVVESKKAGKFKGRASLTLTLAAITVNGNRIPVETGESVSQSGSQGGKTAKRGAIGAGVGAAIGALAGGGKGAAIGAGSGAAIGAGSAALSGQRVKVPPETRLTFTLAQPATIN